MSKYDPEYQRQYRKENAARIKEINRLRKLRDPEKYAAQKKAEYEKHRESYIARAREHWEVKKDHYNALRRTPEFREKINEIRRAQYIPRPKPVPMTRAQKLVKKREDYQLNRERYRKYGNEAYKSNPEKWKGEWQKKQFWQRKFQHGMGKAVSKGALIEHGDGLKLFYKQLFTQAVVPCDYCGQEYSTRYITVDHKTPFALGGEHAVSNLAASCLECNLRKGTMSFDKWIASFK